ncbi:MAG: hypothetical protein AAFQ43_04300 [Bacteroidota bacterium]
MIRYLSPPAVSVEVERNGHVTWEKFRSVVEIDPDHSVRFYREILAVEPGGYVRTPTVLRGTVTRLVPGHRMTLQVRRDDGDKTVTIYTVAGTGELVGELVSQFTDSRHGILLAPEDPTTLFPAPLATPETPAPPPSAPAAPAAAAPRVAAAPRQPVMTLTPEAPISADAFQRRWARLNRHLRRHGGRAASLKRADLSDADLAFITALFSGPLDTLEQDALADIQDFYAADAGRRVHVHVTSFSLPEAPDGAWEIVLGESRWGGVVIVYRADGWSVRDRTLVG